MTETIETPLDRAKAAILPILRDHGIATILITYDGYGDEGNIYEIEALSGPTDDGAAGDESRRRVALPTVDCDRVSVDHLGNVTVDIKTLEDALEAFTELALEQLHEGYENNEGGFGTFTFDVATGQVTLHHEDRYIATEAFEHVL